MKEIWIGIGLYIGLLLGATACERVTFPQELSEEGGANGTEEVLAPDSTGDGTASAPATVTDLKTREDEFLGRSCWVAGYIVGYVERTLKNAAFTTEGAVQSNVLLAADAGVEDVNRCVPVELKTEKWKNALSLAHNPENLGRRVALHGLINTYFGVSGVRSVDGAVWLENEEAEPEEPDTVPEAMPDGQPELPSEPAEEPEEEPGKEPAEETGPAKEEILLYINKVLVQQVDRPEALKDGARYMIGTLPDGPEMMFVAASLKYGTGQAYRKVIGARGAAAHFETEQGIAPAVFILEGHEGEYRLMDGLTGAYLAYDVRGDASSTSWVPLYTLPAEELNQRFAAGFRIDPEEEREQIRTAETIKYSETDHRNCLLRYNSGGNNFKLNYQKNGQAVCLYLLK